MVSHNTGMRRHHSLTVLSLSLLFSAAPLCAQMAVYHQTASVVRGTTRQFTAYVPLSPNTIQWLVNDVPGGNSTVGTVSTTGPGRPVAPLTEIGTSPTPKT